MEIQFDNHDERIKFYELMLERNLKNLPRFPLPDGYRFVFFQKGDREQWINIERSAKELTSYEQGVEVWNKFFGGKDHELTKRMVFIENKEGTKVATATAYYDIRGIDQSGDGWLHWVAVCREYQGKGLAKPLISYVLEIMQGLGYTHAKIPTQTTTWLACKIYLDFGFRPIPKNAVHSHDGWRIVKTLTNHKALADFKPVTVDEMLVMKG
ncbi:GNAT family N-acetyltransferase [Lachnospiraceae bacterium WCA-9-b2]|jgi:GNAT superfamily N-acetyltransferase|uniref:GNAT family N-acetyltransferase n=1 Tax=Sporofaciens musculi TaxID=2681861 RepID=A0A7X3SL00_9FIRM|nr:GNAT family N-acetyltransferase [Sporofaciens musculi]MXP78148.1 GNAT family N-acetyltransferase [Sporofaciens musculi]